MVSKDFNDSGTPISINEFFLKLLTNGTNSSSLKVTSKLSSEVNLSAL